MIRLETCVRHNFLCKTSYMVFFLAILINPLIASTSKGNYDKAFINMSNKYNIDKNMLIAIALTESSLNKYSIGAMPKNKLQVQALHKYLHFIKVKYKYKKNHFRIFAQSYAQAEKVVLVLEYYKINYDLGLTQINSSNIKKRHLDRERILKDELYAFEIGATILKECIKYNKGRVHDSLECYNKGTDRRKYNRSYSSKVLKNYKRVNKVIK